MSAPEEPLDLGHGVRGGLRYLPAPYEGEIGGFYYEHPRPDGKGMCSGWAPTSGPGAWTLVSVEPLTLSPSLLCRACGHHGFVRDGKWAPA